MKWRFERRDEWLTCDYCSSWEPSGWTAYNFKTNDMLLLCDACRKRLDTEIPA